MRGPELNVVESARGESAGVEPPWADRQGWLSLLAKSAPPERRRFLDGFAAPEYVTLRAPEVGMVMVRGRAGGVGAAFNLGEMTVTRAAVRLADGPAGVGYVSGRDLPGAERAAVVDAMMQSPRWRDDAIRLVLAPLAERARTARDEAQRKAAATKVEFFTMVRTREHK